MAADSDPNGMGSPQRDEVLCERAEMHYVRYVGDPANEPDPADLLAELHDDCAAPEARGRIGVLVVLAWIVTDRAFTDADIARGTAAVLAAPPDTPLLTEACYGLSAACLMRYHQQPIPDLIDTALAVLARGFEVTDPDAPATPLLHQSAAVALDARWRLSGDPADRDEAIASGALAVADDRSIWQHHAMLGELLRDRADEHRDLAELDRAIGHLDRAVDNAPADDPTVWHAWHSLGLAYGRRWQLSQDRSDLQWWPQYLRTALARGVPDPDLALQAHANILSADMQLAERLTGESRHALLAIVRNDVAQAYRDVAADADPDRDLSRFAAATAAMAEMSLLTGDPAGVDVDRASYHLNRARRVGQLPAEWRATLSGVIAGLAPYREGTADTDFGRADLIESINTGGVGDTSPTQSVVALVLAEILAGQQTGDRAAFDDVVRLAAVLDPDDPWAGMLTRLADVLRALNDPRPDQAAITAAIGNVMRTIAARPDSDPLRDSVLEVLRSFATLLSPEPETAAGPRVSAATGTMLDQAVATVRMIRTIEAAKERRDLPGLLAALDSLERMAIAAPRTSSTRLERLYLLTMVYSDIATANPGDRRSVDATIRWASEMVDMLPGVEHPRFPPAGMALARALRRRDEPADRVRGRSIGMDVLRSWASAALLQSGTEEAMAAVRAAARDALLVAGWCARDGAHDDLVLALDAGRGLVLHAATTARTVADRLVAVRRPELAAEWDRTGGTGIAELTLPGVADSVPVSGDLRHRVLTALAGDTGATSLLDPPDTATIRAALAAQGSDALVYLVPGTGSTDGMAVLVPASGDVSVLPLPELRDGPGAPIDRYLRADPRPHADGFHEWRSALAELLDWAWHSAGAALHAAAGRWAADALPRLVLVPLGVLAVVPWHAACRVVDGAPRYLVQDAILSYIPSARMFCDAIDRPATRTGAVLVVGNPTGDLASAGAEARALHEAFYRDGTYLGTDAPSGAGSPDEVLDWLTSSTGGSGRPHTLHLACHARAEPTAPLRSRILLAGGDLPVRRLLERAPIRQMPLERVFLAACTTNVSGTDYDEAFSLATTFLAIGTRTAFGSLWRVPDGHTSLLMFLVHHYLNERADRAPADALHLAQLWMLDPHRTAPSTMPDELVLGTAPTASPQDPVCWAGFTHLGA